MRIFLTGATGFLGSCLLRSLLSDGRSYQICICLRDSMSAWRIRDLLDKVEVQIADLSKFDSTAKALARFRPDVVAHLAWNGVQNTDRNAVEQWRNVPQVLELIECAHRVGVKTFVGLGSQAEYGRVTARIDEQTQMHPTTLYGMSKLAAGQLGAVVSQHFGMRFVWLRLFSSYGPGDNPGWMIPYLINTLLAGEYPKLTLAEQKWDYIFVKDVAAAIEAVIQSPSAHGFFNLGSGNARPLRHIIEQIRDLIDPGLPLGFGERPYRQDQVMYLEADISALNQATGWRPMWSYDDGLRETIAWHRENSLDLNRERI